VSKKTVRYALLACLILMPVANASGDLRPDQQAAIDKVLATVDPSMREMVRPQIEQSIRYLNPQQVAMFVAGATGNRSSEQQAAPEPEKREATPEDLAYNRAQYEPALRKHWQARKAFDDLVDAELAAKCPNRDTYAVYREAERYEMMALSPQWQRASDNANIDVQVIGSVYVPQDGRYDFDFSKVRMTFNKEVVANAIAKACADWTKEAAAFKQQAAALMNSDQSEAAFRLEQTAGAKVRPIDEALTKVLEAESPAANYNSAMMSALQNPKPVEGAK
jgi:hypothetical protein